MPHTSAALDALLANLETQAREAGLPAVFIDFARHLCAHFPPDDIATLSADEAYGLCQSLWGLFSKREPGQIALRIRSPHLENLAWADGFAVVETVNDDRPFLVDSLTNALSQQGYAVQLVVHPVIGVERDGSGNATDVTSEKKNRGLPLESVMHIRIDPVRSADEATDLQQYLRHVLEDVQAATGDWAALQQAVRGINLQLNTNRLPVSAGERDEARAFLDWLLDNNFTFLGYRHLDISGDRDSTQGRQTHITDGSGLGLLRDANRPVFDGTRDVRSLPEDIQAFLDEPRLVHFSKSHMNASVHRSVPMDVISIKDFDDDGQLVGEHRLLGLFTSQAYHSNPVRIPLVRRKVGAVLDKAGFDATSHDGKALLHILQTFPRDELYQARTHELLQISLGILYLQERQRVALFVRRESFGRFISCFVYIPRDRYTTALRQKIQHILEQHFGGTTRDYQTHVEQSPLARVYFVLALDSKAARERSCVIDHADLEQRLQEASRSWNDQLKHQLYSGGSSDARALFAGYKSAFPQLYQDRYTAKEATRDIAAFSSLSEHNRRQLRLYRRDGDAASAFNVKIYTIGQEALPLSDVMPVLEHLGLKVLSEETYEVSLEAGSRWVHDFAVVTTDGSDVALDEAAPLFRDALLAVLAGNVDDDSLNQLALLAQVPVGQAVVLRAYGRYLQQIGFAYNFSAIAAALAAHPSIARGLLEYFSQRFNPACQADSNEAAVCTSITESLQGVRDVAEDRILGTLQKLIGATLRTSFYKRGEGGQPLPYISVKLRSADVPDLPLPRPDTEIFVYAPYMESIHLRGGKVARGGIRWSDRKQDYRTEVLGLVKAQMVKNAVIVPVGSKGGFYCKQLPDTRDRDAVREEVVRCYTTMMQGMLDITDTIRKDTVVPPKDVVRHDGDDPYLVVAADKGTATFSDIANAIAADYGFWLDDAFASGGSQGYDHKKMGITARGAWEAVKRHFRELGKDIQSTDFTVIGIGDMAGDVFGNGMLLSKHIRLLAAFNHRHIFVDPDPDATLSFAERERLFNTPGTQWSDYNRDVLSEGGAVFERDSKTCVLTPQIKSMLGTECDTLPPADLIKALLRHQAELLWFGGIGTFVRASDESNADADDKANDALRVTAPELGAQVVGEGANLGMTQRARIEFGLNGGRLNTDAIDNSAGVDTSDHEVNIKILLQNAMENGHLQQGERNPLLAAMTDDVAALVLRNNYLQTQALSQARYQGLDLLHHHGRLIKSLESSGQLNPAIEFLPDDKTLDLRFQQQQPLTRPELSVLLAYSKIDLFNELIDSGLPDEQHMLEEARLYFPKELRERFTDGIAQHPLRREIIATVTANSLVNRMGSHFVNEVKLFTGRQECDIARAYTIVRDSLGLRDWWAQIEALDGHVDASVQLDMLCTISKMVEQLTLWFLRNQYPLNVTDLVASYRPDMQELTRVLPQCLSEYRRGTIIEAAGALTARGVPEELAQIIAYCRPMASACNVLRLARQYDVPIREAGEMYFRVSHRFGCHWLRDALRAIPVTSSWQQQALSALINDVYDAHQRLAGTILASEPQHDEGTESRIASWAERQGHRVERYDTMLREVKAQKTLDVAIAMVSSRMLGQLAG